MTFPPTLTFWLSGLPLLWLVALAGMLFSALLLSRPGLHHIIRHARIARLPALLALMTAMLCQTHTPVFGTPLAWLMASLILGLGSIVQQFSVRFLQGDRDQPRALFWFSVLTASAALCWLQNDLRLMLLAWGIALHALTNLIGLTRDWPAARAARRRAGRWLSLAWLALAALILLNAWELGGWRLDNWHPERWQGWAQHVGAALLLLAVLIPAAQWPAQRWLMESMVAPTPVSAIMHAGMVNAGGILLLYFGSLLALADWARALLLAVAICSIVMGCGMAMVQADIKRQLAASTVAQMACMLLQIALGAYLAAIIHLLLHGLFKAALFLQAGGARQGAGVAGVAGAADRHALRQPWAIGIAGTTLLLAILMAALLWPASLNLPLNWHPEQMLKGLDAGSVLPNLILLLALLQSLPLLARQWAQWRHWRTLLLALGGMFACQWLLENLLGPTLPVAPALPAIWMWTTLGLLLAGSLLLALARRYPNQGWARRVYWHLIAASEADPATQDAHPAFLAHRLQQGVLA